jgi:hypothetical protein
VAGIPKDVKGAIILPTEKTRSNCAKFEAEGFKQEWNTIGSPSPQEQIPRRRGRPRKRKEAMEAQV